MEQVLPVIGLVLGAAVVVLLIVVLIKLSRGGGDSAPLYSALGEVRREVNEQNDRTRQTLQTGIDQVASKSEQMTERAFNMQLAVTKTLNEMEDKLGQSDRRSAEALAAAIEKLQLSNEKKLEEMRRTVDEKLTGTLTTRLDSSFQAVSQQLTNVYQSLGEMKELSGGVQSLNRVFAGVKTRGVWAETQLQGLLDKIVPGMYVTNYRPDPAKNEVVEFAVRLPDPDGRERYLPIDSKFPVEDYLRLCDAADAGDAEGVKNARGALSARVLAQAKDVSKYIREPETAPFALLYLATDALYAEIVSSKDNVVDQAHQNYRVLPVGPSTLTAMLTSVALGYRTVSLNEKAEEVMGLLATAKAQYDKFAEALAKTKRKLEEAEKSLDEASSRNDIIVKKLRSVEAPSLPEE